MAAATITEKAPLIGISVMGKSLDDTDIKLIKTAGHITGKVEQVVTGTGCGDEKVIIVRIGGNKFRAELGPDLIGFRADGRPGDRDDVERRRTEPDHRLDRRLHNTTKPAPPAGQGGGVGRGAGGCGSAAAGACGASA